MNKYKSFVLFFFTLQYRNHLSPGQVFFFYSCSKQRPGSHQFNTAAVYIWSFLSNYSEPYLPSGINVWIVLPGIDPNVCCFLGTPAVGSFFLSTVIIVTLFTVKHTVLAVCQK